MKAATIIADGGGFFVVSKKMPTFADITS